MSRWFIGILCVSALMVIVGNWSLYNVIVLVVIALTVRWIMRYRRQMVDRLPKPKRIGH